MIQASVVYPSQTSRKRKTCVEKDPEVLEISGCDESSTKRRRVAKTKRTVRKKS